MDAPAHARIALLEHGTQINDFYMTKEVLTIGRGRENDVRLSYPAISRFHAQIVLVKPGQYLIRDLTSRNGTLVNSERILEQKLKNGDRIQLGRFTLIFTRLGEL